MAKDLYKYTQEYDGPNTLHINITNSDKILFKKHIEKKRHFIEISKLFHIYLKNYDHLFSKIKLLKFDTILFLEKLDIDDEELEIEINTFTNNVFASGQALMESIDIYLNHNLGEVNFDQFRDQYSSKVYKKYFSYRWLRFLRNYSQHGHILVEVENRRARFNLDNIINKPHTDGMGKYIKSEIINIRDDIVNTFSNNPFISYSSIILELDFCITKVFMDFLNFIKENFMLTSTEINDITNQKPEIIYNGLILYEIEGTLFHVFNPNDNDQILFSKLKKETKTHLTFSENKLANFRKK